MRAAIYARYSTDLQRDASIEDQQRLCRKLIASNQWVEVQTYADRGLSGSSHLRPAYQSLLCDARDGKFDVVVAEGLDRISRDQEHIAAFFKQMQFLGIPILTAAEGEVSELHIGLKGTMSSLFLKDLAQKTRRGLEGRIRNGKSAGGIVYGYTVVRDLNDDGSFTTGERTINEDEATIVRRIFTEYSQGHSPRSIAARLNAESIPGPRGKGWGMSTIYGNWRRGTGILNNELYIGRLVWNRQRFIKDPSTGKRQARLNPQEEWVIEEVEDLRIVDDDLWQAVKERQEATRNAVICERLRPENARRPKHLFSGMLTCGVCGGGYTIVGKDLYGCANARNKGTCDNRVTIKRSALEARILHGLQHHLLHPDLIAAFVSAYTEEYNRLSREAATSKSDAEQELQTVNTQIARLVDAIAEGMFHPSMREKLDALEARKTELADILSAPQDAPDLLHPALSEMYRAKVRALTDSLNDPAVQTEARMHLRELIESITLIPVDGNLEIELVGALAGLLALGEQGGGQQKTVRIEGSTDRSVSLVAGVGFEPTTFRL